MVALRMMISDKEYLSGQRLHEEDGRNEGEFFFLERKSTSSPRRPVVHQSHPQP